MLTVDASHKLFKISLHIELLSSAYYGSSAVMIMF